MISLFTGIIEEMGRIVSVQTGGGITTLNIAVGKTGEGLKVGDSLAVNGVCLTVVSLGNGLVTANVMPETLHRTGLGHLRTGDTINLERAVRPSDRLGGHLVLGHVDAAGRVVSIARNEGSVILEIGVPKEIMRFIAAKGSIAIDGASLTVVDVKDHTFTVAIIPHTINVTTLGTKRPGDALNVEVDVIARYIERLLTRSSVCSDTGDTAMPPIADGQKKKITAEFLAEHGFLRESNMSS